MDERPAIETERLILRPVELLSEARKKSGESPSFKPAPSLRTLVDRQLR